MSGVCTTRLLFLDFYYDILLSRHSGTLTFYTYFFSSVKLYSFFIPILVVCIGVASLLVESMCFEGKGNPFNFCGIFDELCNNLGYIGRHYESSIEKYSYGISNASIVLQG